MGQQHQGPPVRHRSAGLNNSPSRLLHRDRPHHSLNRFRQMKTTPSRSRTAPHHAELGRWPLTLTPAAMQITQQIELTLEHTAAGILPAIMIAKNHRHRMRQTGDGLGQPQIPITEITDEQHRIGSETLQQRAIGITPVTVQIACDGKPKPGTRGCQGQCLGCVPSCRRWS